MRHDRPWNVLWAATLSAGCVPDPPTAEPAGAPQVSIEPLADGAAAPVVRLRVRDAGAALAPEELGLFSGRLSDYHLGRVARRDLPGTLLERRVPVHRFRDAASGEIVVAPEIALARGETYTLVTPRWGRLVEFRVASDETLPLLERVWPPRGYAGGGLAVFCGAGAPSEPIGFELDPVGRVAEATPLGTGPDPACVAVRFDASGLEGVNLVFPAALAGFAFDPAPLAVGAPSAIAPRACADDELVVGPGCARVEDDRVIVTGPDAPLLWLATSGATRMFPALDGAPFALRGLAPETAQRLSGVAMPLAAAEAAFDVEVRTTAPRARLVLNEVLANPLGAEASAEWIELVNDGAAPADLSGVELEDSAAAVALPPERVAPGEHVLLTRRGFAAGSADVVPAPGTRLIALPDLGKQGLSNAGEALFLWGPAGERLSYFPPRASRRAGASVARARPDAPDADPAAFADHAEPGASPGAPNRLAEAAP